MTTLNETDSWESIYNLIIILMDLSMIVSSLSILYILKEFKAMGLWSVSVGIALGIVFQTDVELRFSSITILPFFGLACIYTYLQLKKRMQAAIKRIEEREKEELRHE
ncbi:MAG: hypothetical protein WC680_11115 [Sulfuricurvum sp.]|jgi:hypothetical protein